jgi:hypothetical protein
MKRMMASALLCLLMPLLACGSGPSATSPLPASMKGYELYSWQKGDQWHFTLITGTNRAKNVEEITTGGSTVSKDGWVDIQVTGEDAILDVIRRLPAGEWVFWMGCPNCGQAEGVVFQTPPQEVVDAIAARARAQGLTLSPPAADIASTGVTP